MCDSRMTGYSAVIAYLHLNPIGPVKRDSRKVEIVESGTKRGGIARPKIQAEAASAPTGSQIQNSSIWGVGSTPDKTG